MQLHPRNCPERSRPGLPRCLQMPQVQEMPAGSALALARPRGRRCQGFPAPNGNTRPSGCRASPTSF
ncbi:hypothetical protein V8C26DRAFT_389916 [Trichoderma gracile]